MMFAVLSLAVLSILQRAVSLPVAVDTNGHVAAAWYGGWHARSGFPLSDVSWNKYNTLIYSFAVTTPSANSLSLEASEPSFLPQFVSQAHDNGVAAHIGIGGWTGSGWFSSSLDTPENRTTFVQTVVNLAQQYDLDGINFDWEYPNEPGIGSNTISPDDADNFLSFLQELRANSVGAKLTLSAATPTTPFRDASGNPSTDVSGFAKVLDYIMIMDYDVWGPWSPTVGPNAPLDDTCAPPGDRKGSAVSAVKAWNAAGMPVNRIVLGVAAYGHSYSVPPSNAFATGSNTQLATYPNFDASNQPEGDDWANHNIAGSSAVSKEPAGTYEFWSLINDGFLDTNGNPASGIYYRYDRCSQTPYLYDRTSEIMVSYDNPQSFTAKGNFIKQRGLRGFAMWEAGSDYHDMLLDSIRGSAGY